MLLFLLAIIPSSPFSFASWKRAFPRLSTYPPTWIPGTGLMICSSLACRCTTVLPVKSCPSVQSKSNRKKTTHLLYFKHACHCQTCTEHAVYGMMNRRLAKKGFLALCQENHTRMIHFRGSVRGVSHRKVGPIETKPVSIASAEELAALQPKQLEQCYICKVWCSNAKSRLARPLSHSTGVSGMLG